MSFFSTHLLFFLLHLSTLFSINSSNLSSKQKYFEGEIIFKVEYIPINPRVSEKKLIQLQGDTIVAFIKEDKYKMVYNTKGNQGKLTYVYSAANKKSYIDYEKSDTIVWSSIEEPSGKLLKLEKTNEKLEILGNTCQTIAIDYTPADTSIITRVSGKYYYSDKFLLNPAQYRYCYQSFWNQYAQAAKALSIRNEIEYYPLYKMVYTAVQIKEKPVNESIFSFNPSKVLYKSQN